MSSPNLRIIQPKETPGEQRPQPPKTEVGAEEASPHHEYEQDEYDTLEEPLAARTRRRRANHNEIERHRRVQQKQRLLELRMAIPGLGEESMAAIHIITRAKEYIDFLKGRVTELEMFTRTLVEASRGQSTLNGNLIHQTLLAQQQPTVPDAPATTAAKPGEAKRAKSPLADVMLSPTASLDDMEASAASRQRKSSLIFPTGDSNLLFGQRDSLQQLFAGIMPSLLEDTNQFDIRCVKCAGGINNLIMIDCDKCHEWYHIRCVGINTSAIPSNWLCPECRSK